MNDAFKCTKCGLCRKSCPIFRVTLKETDSPRGKAILLSKEILTDHLYRCTLCGSCTVNCPLNIDMNFRKLRSKLPDKYKDTLSNKKMIENIRKYGNPFGKFDKDNPPKELYCC